jgi:hypothetical protein
METGQRHPSETHPDFLIGGLACRSGPIYNLVGLVWKGPEETTSFLVMSSADVGLH